MLFFQSWPLPNSHATNTKLSNFKRAFQVKIDKLYIFYSDYGYKGDLTLETDEKELEKLPMIIQIEVHARSPTSKIYECASVWLVQH